MSDAIKNLVPTWIVYVDGKRLDVQYEGMLEKIVINDKLNGAGTFELYFNATGNDLLYSETFSLTSHVSIHLGYKDDAEKVFDGEVTSFEESLDTNNHAQIKVNGCNVLYKLMYAKHFVSYENKNYKDIIKEILEKYSLEYDIDSFGPKIPFESAHGVSDFDFILELAKRYGKDVYAFGNKVYVKDTIQIKKDEIVFEWGKSLMNFYCIKDIASLFSDCQVSAWDSQKCCAISANARISSINRKVGGTKAWTSFVKDGKRTSNIIDESIYDNEDAMNVALGYLQHNSYNFMNATGKAEGTYKLLPGMIVSIKYVGNQFSGDYIADSVTHELDRKGFTTSFSLKRNMC